MNSIRIFSSQFVTSQRIFFCIFLFYFAIVARADDDVVRLRFWGMHDTQDMKGRIAQIWEFNQRNPKIQVVIGTPGGRGDMDPQKLMTAIAGGDPPEVVRQDRFAVSGWAARGAFLPLDSLIYSPKHNPRDSLYIDPDDFYEACWNEAVYNDKLYAIPYVTDDRILYYNKQLFRLKGLDPEKPPRYWDELWEFSKTLTFYDQEGDYATIGFIPLFGNNGLYMYGWQNGGKFMSPDGRTCTLNHPRNIEALEFIVALYDSLGGREEKVSRFEATWSGATGGGGTMAEPFINEKVAMKIDGSWYLQTLARYSPDMDIGVAPAPVPRGEPFMTWSGGFSLVIPVGCKNVAEAWQFIRWMVSPAGATFEYLQQKKYNDSVGFPYSIPYISARPSNNDTLRTLFKTDKPALRQGYELCMDMMKVSRYRPVTPAGQTLWDNVTRATDLATYHEFSPREALDRGTATVQAELDHLFGEPVSPVWNISTTLMAFALVFLVAVIWGIFRIFRYRRTSLIAWHEMQAGYLFALPWLIGFTLLTLGPMVVSLLFSFSEYDVLHQARFIGLDNFKNLLGFHKSIESGGIAGYVANDPLFWKSLWNTVYISLIGVPLSLVVGLSIALLLNKDVKGIPLYRTLYYLPSIVPVIATAILWSFFLNPKSGLVNYMLKIVGIRGPNWTGDASWTKMCVVLMLLWGAGGSMVIWLAGLKNIPRTLYEASEIDGANLWQKFWRITLPILTPTIFFNLIMGIISYFQIFTQAYVLIGNNTTTAGPKDSLLFYVLYLFNSAFQHFKMGYASAMAWILFLLILILTLINFKLAPRWVHYGGGDDA
ncbi:extracellular solute-binding protein [candidate division KSB1 bacterium]|nr:extracellular solute-binding protein [candidate division KSB1 bacterium]